MGDSRGGVLLFYNPEDVRSVILGRDWHLLLY